MPITTKTEAIKTIDIDTLRDNVIRAAQALSTGVRGEKLLSMASVRRDEYATLTNVVKTCLELNRREFFLISGTPGVGKTFLMHQITTQLQLDGLVHPIYVNCFELATATQVFDVIHTEILNAYGVSMTSTSAAKKKKGEGNNNTAKRRKVSATTSRATTTALEQCCRKSWEGIRPPGDKRLLLLALDELDTLVVSSDSLKVIFTLLDLLRYPGCNLCIFGISNQVGLPVLQETRLTSRCMGTLIVKPYTEKDIFAVLEQRLKTFHADLVLSGDRQFPIFSKIAVQLILRKCGGIQGDARRVLHACEHVLLRLIGESERVWLDLVKLVDKYNQDASRTSVPADVGLVSADYTVASTMNLVTSSFPELQNLPVMCHFVLAALVCAHRRTCEKQQQHPPPAASASIGIVDADGKAVRAMPVLASNDQLRQQPLFHADTSIPIDTLLEDIAHHARRIGAADKELTTRLTFFPGLRFALNSLIQLGLVRETASHSEARGNVR
eukprot:PhM_4_TR2661/c0_g1_i1/m.15806/K02213/CDC6; cell division control protein 6